MSILFADDFKGYGSTIALLLNGLWGNLTSDLSLDNDPDPLASGKVLHLRDSFASPRRVFANGSNTVIGVAQRIWMVGLPTYQAPVIQMLDALNNTLACLVIMPTGTIEIRKGPNGATLAATATPVMIANAWTHLEVKFTAGAGATGAAEVRVNGTSVLTVNTVDIGAAFFQYSQSANSNLAGGYKSVEHYIKDLVVWNGTGTYNTDFQGTVSVLGGTTVGDITLGGWTLSTGVTGWNLLNLSPPNDGVDYISAPYPPPVPAKFSLSNLPVNVTSVRAMISQIRARKVDGGDGSLQTSLVSTGGSTVNGANRPITTAFTYYEDVFEVDPNTAAPWTPAAAAAAQLKINRTV